VWGVRFLKPEACGMGRHFAAASGTSVLVTFLGLQPIEKKMTMDQVEHVALVIIRRRKLEFDPILPGNGARHILDLVRFGGLVAPSGSSPSRRR
jgi:hypothetical protein